MTGGRIGTKLLHVLDEWWQTRIRPAIRTAGPAFVTKYDHATRTATVQPTIKQRWSDGRPLNDGPPLSGRPVVQVTRGGGWVITHGLEAGDQVLTIACDRALDSWQPSPGDKTVAPQLRRYHDLSDTVVIPGLAAAGGTPTVGGAGELYLGDDEGLVSIRLGADGSITLTPRAGATIKIGGDAAVEPLALHAEVMSILGDILGVLTALQAKYAALALVSWPVDGAALQTLWAGGITTLITSITNKLATAAGSATGRST